MAAVLTLICRRCNSPAHSVDRKLELKMKLSPDDTLGLLVVAAAAAPYRATSAVNAVLKPEYIAAGSDALK